MIKRANKITALLIAATSIMSLVPAMAADSTRLASKEGTIQDAVVFKDGKYIYEGYKTDGDNKSVYYNNGESDKEINDLTDATLGDKYNNDSVIAEDGSDEYLVNLSDGKVTEEDVASDLQSTATDKLETKLEKTDRYGSNVSVSLDRITQNQFGDVWYSYTATKEDSTGTKAMVSADIPSATYTTPSAITLAGKTFGAPNAGVAAAYTVTIAADATDVYAPLTLGGVAITTANTTATDNTELSTAIAAKAADLTAAGYSISAVPSAFSAGANTTSLTITKTVVGVISDNVNDFVYLKSGDSTQVKVSNKGTDKVTGYTSEADLISQIQNANYDNFTVVVTKTATGLNVLFTQKYGSTYSAVTGFAIPGVTPSLVRAGVGTGITSNDVYNGYTNQSGAYVDADKTANIRVYNGSKMVKLDKFDEDANDDGIAATVTNSTTIAQDKDYIYRVIDVTFTAGTVYDSKGGAQITTAKYLQKISKAQGDTEKDAYLPKSVESYEITNAIGNDDATTAYNKLVKYATGTDSSIVGLRVIDGAIYYTEMDDTDTIKTYVLKLQKNEKVEAAGSSSKVDAYVVKKDGDVDHDLKGDAGKAGASIDVNGNLWIVNEGKIYKSEKAGDFTEMFTCDRTIDSLDVYDANSLIAWTEGQDVYVTVGKTATETPVETPVTTTGWVNTATGWTFLNTDGSQVKGQWVKDGGVWYMIKADGIMATGWVNDNGTWYFLAGSGAMKTGWVNDNGTWYFLAGSGAMKTGWVNDNGTWYYLNASGAMLANTTVDGYKLNASGAWVK